MMMLQTIDVYYVVDGLIIIIFYFFLFYSTRLVYFFRADLFVPQTNKFQIKHRHYNIMVRHFLRRNAVEVYLKNVVVFGEIG